jgi:hypothetical protein
MPSLTPLLSRHTRRLLAAWLGVLAIVAQALLPIAHPMAPPRALTADAAALGKIVICTPYGFKLVSLDEVPGEDTKRKAASQFCPLCQAVQAATALLPPDGPALGCVAAETTVAFFDPGTASAPPPATGPPQARAPPSFA